jgi:hypothetical protein
MTEKKYRLKMNIKAPNLEVPIGETKQSYDWARLLKCLPKDIEDDYIWFEPVEDKAEVLEIFSDYPSHNILISDKGRYARYCLHVSQEIPLKKYSAIKQAIEHILNGEELITKKEAKEMEDRSYKRGIIYG